MNNRKIREALEKAKMKQWQLADLMHIREEALCRKLRYELPAEEQEQIVKLIKYGIPLEGAFQKKAKSNLIIRKKLREHDKPNYWLAHILGVNEQTMTRWLRYELPQEKQDEIMAAIEDAINAETK